MTDTFSRVPLEIWLIILQNVRDLPSFYRFICASSQVKDAFDFDPARVLDEVIDRSIPHFKHLARMISIMGSLNIQNGPDIQSSHPSSQPTFTALIDKFKSLPKDVLETALPSYAFATNTPGPRYLLLTAYRIEHLFHICFVTLLQNIHELIFESGPGPDRKSSRPGIFFEPAAWWSPSWVERVRVERALWKLFIYWNIRAIDPGFPGSDTFRYYSSCIQMLGISPSVGPCEVEEIDREHNSYEVEEMNCISDALREFLFNRSPFKFFTALSSQDRKFFIQHASSRFSLIFDETLHWKFEEPNLLNSMEVLLGQNIDSVSDANAPERSYYWHRWETTSGATRHFPDYLGLCLWDTQRLCHLGLSIGVFLDSNPFKSITKNPRFFKSTQICTRWRDVFLEELARLPGGRKRSLYRYENKLISWSCEISSQGIECDLKWRDIYKYGKNLQRLFDAHDTALSLWLNDSIALFTNASDS